MVDDEYFYDCKEELSQMDEELLRYIEEMLDMISTDDV